MQMTEYYSDHISFLRNRALSRAMAKIHSVGATVSLWRSRQRERRALMKLDDRFLRDIGITRRQALEEANKPFWIGKPRQYKAGIPRPNVRFWL